MLTKDEEEIRQCPVYLTISNLSHEIWRLWVRPEGIMVVLITIYKGDSFDVQIEIYHQNIRVITKDKCNKRH